MFLRGEFVLNEEKIKFSRENELYLQPNLASRYQIVATNHKNIMHKNFLFLAASLLLATTSCASKANKTETITNASQDTPTTIANPSDPKAVPATIIPVDQALNGHDAFETIKNKYKGKVVLIDFWATWCPPCRAAMKEVDQIKPELLKKGAVFVYVTGETSPEAEWKNALQVISGDHYRLTEKQWNELGGELNMPGIPAYMLLNKDGSVAYSNVTEGGYPGNSLIQNQIETALTK